MRAALDDLGASQPPGLALRCVNRIPHGRGLGSSAAAIVAGVLAARALAGADTSADAALPLASELEGHPDNVAPCLYGGLTIAWMSSSAEAGFRGPPRVAWTEWSAGAERPSGAREGDASTGRSARGPVGLVPAPRARAVRVDPLPQIRPVAIIAPSPVSTEVARGLLPEQVPHADAARNAGRAALLIAALTARPGALLEATEDRLHQGYRAPAMPETADLVSRLRAAGIPAVVSGAGPSVLAFVQAAVTGRPAVDLAVLDSTVRETGIGWLISSLDVERRGASVAPIVANDR
jgi:homoserine kinase